MLRRNTLLVNELRSLLVKIEEIMAGLEDQTAELEQLRADNAELKQLKTENEMLKAETISCIKR